MLAAATPLVPLVISWEVRTRLAVGLQSSIFQYSGQRRGGIGTYGTDQYEREYCYSSVDKNIFIVVS